MAQNQCTIGVNAGSLNSVQVVENGVNSAEGRVNYTLNNPQDSSNENGTIIFNTGTNNATIYYTGRKLPLYSAGKTVWYVDSEGVISLKIDDKEYGNGQNVDIPPVEEEGEEIVASDNPMLKRYVNDDNTDFYADEYRTKIKFATNVKVPNTKIESWDVSDAKDGSVMAWIKDDGNSGYELTIAGKERIIANSNAYSLMDNFPVVKEIENIEKIEDLTLLNLSRNSSLEKIDLSKIENNKIKMINFQNCSMLKELDFSKIDMSKITSMYFDECSSLEKINFGNLEGCKITRLDFSGCKSLKSLDLSGIDTGSMEYMNQMFSGCSSLSNLYLSNFDTQNVKEMNYMFNGCSSLTELDLGNFNLNNVTDMNDMFKDCVTLKTLNIPAFGISQPSANRMFKNCLSLTATITINGNIPFKTEMFSFAAKYGKITLNYTEGLESVVNRIKTEANMSNCNNIAIGEQVE